jgi:hypothetical protein
LYSGILEKNNEIKTLLQKDTFDIEDWGKIKEFLETNQDKLFEIALKNDKQNK